MDKAAGRQNQHLCQLGWQFKTPAMDRWPDGKLFKAPRPKTLKAMAHKSTAPAKNEAAIKNGGCKILNSSQKSDKRCVFWHNVDNFFFAKINHLIAEKLITATLSAIEPKRVLGACSSPFGIALGWSLG
ncbi:MAG TPA: hypothetical protein PLX52_09695 [Comamonas denitrificans]|nr:hypothetical protein [Comamonas denitrificans]